MYCFQGSYFTYIMGLKHVVLALSKYCAIFYNQSMKAIFILEILYKLVKIINKSHKELYNSIIMEHKLYEGIPIFYLQNNYLKIIKLKDKILILINV